MYRENWAALWLWADLWPRWRVLVGVRSAVRQGLDLAQVQAAMQLSGVREKRRAQIYRDLLVMEEEALEVLAQRA